MVSQLLLSVSSIFCQISYLIYSTSFQKSLREYIYIYIYHLYLYLYMRYNKILFNEKIQEERK